METADIMASYSAILETESSDNSNSTYDSSIPEIAANVLIADSSSLSETKSFTEDMINHEDMDLNNEQREFFCYLLQKFEFIENELNNEKLNNINLNEKIYNLEIKCRTQGIKLNNVNHELSEIDYDLYEMDCRIIKNDQYSRRDNLIISGIPESVHQKDLQHTVLKILNTIGMRISSYEVTACHRLRSKGKYPSHSIVRFTNRKIVDFCFNNRDRLRECKPTLGMNLRFYENLCLANEYIVNQCTIMLSKGFIESYKIKNGFIKITVSEGDRPILIKHPDDLKFHFNNYFDSLDDA